MRDRKHFLTALGFASAAFTFVRNADAAPSPLPAESAGNGTQPAPASPSPGAVSKRRSARALAVAATMSGFDAKLSASELDEIAAGIDENLKASAVLNPKKKRLRNADEPVTVFRATPA